MTPVTDKDGFDPLAAIAADFHVYLGDQRAGGVKYLEPATFSFALYRPGDAMGAEDHVIVIGNLVEFIDEYRPLLLEIIDHVAIMHDFMTDVDRGAKEPYSTFDDFNGAIYPGAKTAWIGKQNFH
jgi:hypothetical protein